MVLLLAAGALPETWVDDTADDGEALCTSGDLSQQAVEHVRWSNAQLRQIDVDWEGVHADADV